MKASIGGVWVFLENLDPSCQFFWLAEGGWRLDKNPDFHAPTRLESG